MRGISVRVFSVGAAAVALVACALPAGALERHARRLDDERLTPWAASCTSTLAYYNNCTGWIWVWNLWSPGEQIGVCYDTLHPNCRYLGYTEALVYSPAPSGYGFTGTISIESACDCSGTTLASQPFLPTSGWNAWAWGINFSGTFLVRFTWGAPPGLTNPTKFASDHPAAGPTGPTACGRCFPATRSAHSFHFGVGGSACPGEPLSDGTCDVEFMSALGYVWCGDCWPTGAEDLSWGRIKSLYD